MNLSIRCLSEDLVKPHQAQFRQYNRFVNLLKRSINHAVCLEDFHGVESLCIRADSVLYMFWKGKMIRSVKSEDL